MEVHKLTIDVTKPVEVEILQPTWVDAELVRIDEDGRAVFSYYRNGVQQTIKRDPTYAWHLRNKVVTSEHE